MICENCIFYLKRTVSLVIFAILVGRFCMESRFIESISFSRSLSLALGLTIRVNRIDCLYYIKNVNTYCDMNNLHMHTYIAVDDVYQIS